MPETKPNPPPKPKLRFDWEEWLPYLEDWDAPAATKREMIETLSMIVECFIDMKWEVIPDATNAPETCGQVTDLAAVLRAAVVNSKGQTITEQEEV
ncbi:MAG: hypothetical protein AAGF13_04535 [Pseudomonadota bacterium]